MAEESAESNTYIDRPNRDKATSKLVKFIVTLLLLGSAALVAIISYGGWDELQGARGLQIAYIILYVVLALFIFFRWARGLLPVAAALAIVLLIFAAVSGMGWYERDSPGFAESTINASLIGTLTLLLVPVQVALIVFAAGGFSQAWNIEIERTRDDPDDHDDDRGYDDSGALPAT